MASKKLSVYRAKRDFTKTAEPSGERAVKSSKQLRYVIQKHAARRLHYDLRLELDGVFKSWAVTRGPSLNPDDKRLAVEVEDHPLDYGDFEGTIPHGEYGGGTVMLWDRGYWQPEEQRSPQQSLKAGELKFTLQGERLYGSWVLVRMRGDRYGGKRTNWLLIKHREEHAPKRKTMPEDRSVASARNMKQIAAGEGRAPTPFMLAKKTAAADAVWRSNRGEARAAPPKAVPARAAKTRQRRAKTSGPPEFIPPQLCKLVDRPPAGEQWLHEIKFDGYRLQLRVADGRATLKTRKGLDWTHKFAAIAAAASALPDCIIDGEAVALNEHGAPNFSALQAALSDGRTDELVFYAFDLLFADGEDLQRAPLEERKAALKSLLEANELGAQIRYVDHIKGSATDVWRSACQMELEGIISKRADGAYSSGRGNGWTKTKCRAGQEVVIGGWTTDSGVVRSLLVGVMHGQRLLHVGRVGTGFGERARGLAKRLRALAVKDNPFEGDNKPRLGDKVRWVKPELVAEIEFAGWTDSGMVRQAAFKGLREDKSSREVQAEKPVAPKRAPEVTAAVSTKMAKARVKFRSSVQAKTSHRAPDKTAQPREISASRKNHGSDEILGVAISNANKALWPDDGEGHPVTKADLAHYYENVSDWLLPHIKGRPCSLVRMPDGIHGRQKFFQRHAMDPTSELITLTKVSGDHEPYLQLDSAEALIAAAQTAALELHPWNCEPGKVETPGRLVFDLDPAPDLSFDDVIKAALELRERLEQYGLACFCKTTGGKGLHVVTPLAPQRKGKLDWPTAKAFAQGVCAQMANDAPDRYLINMSKKLRVGRIFLDYLRNDRTSTAVAPLSPRARDGATVSMPLNWNQVRAGLDPKRYTLRTAKALLKKSGAWKTYCDAERPLDDAIKKLVKDAA